MEDENSAILANEPLTFAVFVIDCSKELLKENISDSLVVLACTTDNVSVQLPPAIIPTRFHE